MYRQVRTTIQTHCNLDGCNRKCGLFHGTELKITTDSDLNYLSSPLNSAEPLTPMNKSPTFDEVLESAKRKVSRDFVDIRLQNVIEEEIEFDRRALAGSTPYPEEFRQDSTLLEGLDDTDSDEDPWFAQSPPSDITVDDTVEELIRETQPPPDHYSNPLYRKADSLKKKRVNHTNSNSSIDLSVADFAMNDTSKCFLVIIGKVLP
ncbi:unnamed protein product [Bursaphelenchus xylophilus]|uniref:(pine wood nematode) hypothetical protein n=1 Tax=Bursaphelenchus xylophilus TaxID=6326 RepID=A0A7I8X0R6_BURXY|nr:unnamed protein product [Bursaphelenchus xylophilus]CAG9130000.1 unnamed protein product [Bursaphelenchus xylophilus]